MLGRLGAALAAVSAVLLLAACSSGGRAYHGPPTFPGLSSIGPSLGVSAPNGIAGVTGSTSGKARPSKSASSSAAGRSSGVATAGGHAPAPGHTTTAGGAHVGSTAHTTAPAPPPSGPQVTVSPASGLHDKQKVQVVGTGFPANLGVLIVECHADAVDQSKCIIDLSYVTHTDASGRVTKTYTVRSTVAHAACTASNPCVVSVSELKQPPKYEADAPIRFA